MTEASSAALTPGRSAYTYEPLPGSTKIRLIKLYPLKPEDGPRGIRAAVLSPIHIDLIHVSFDEAPRYTAISYTWGVSPASVPINVGDSGYVLVTGSARSILDRLRPQAGNMPNYFWMDQLCIDQFNEEEKSHQIKIMRQIYEKAIGTFIMLAEATSIDDIFIHQIDLLKLAPLLNRPGSYAKVDGGPVSLAHFLGPSTIPEAMLNLFNNDIFRSHMKKILENAVFSRAWIYQEIVSSRRAFLVAHNLRLDWDIFTRAFAMLLRFNAAYTQEALDFHNKSSLNLIVNDRIKYHGGGGKDWSRLLADGQGILKAKDPRDNVIALTTFQDFYKSIPPYHTLSVADMYTRTALVIIKTTKTLDVLAGITGTWQYEGQSGSMPSWVPDWSKPREAVPLQWPQTHTEYNASNGYRFVAENAEITSASSDTIPGLTVRGKQIDKVTVNFAQEHAAFPAEGRLPDKLGIQAIGAYWLTHTEKRGCALVTGERTFQNYLPILRALVAAATASFPSTDTFQDDGFIGQVPDIFYDELIFMLAYYDEIMEGQDVYHNGKPSFLSTIPSTYGSWKEGMTKLRQWTSICNGRQFALGEKQGMGLIPATALAGDIICILHGSKVPVVLRRYGQRYVVRGQCYWRGWMYGDQVDWEEGEGMQFELM